LYAGATSGLEIANFLAEVITSGVRHYDFLGGDHP
jgi:hypothetical protein